MGGNPSRVRLNGPLETFGVGFAAELVQLGYKKNSTADQLRLMAHLSRWLAAERRDVAELTPSVTDAFLAERRGAGYKLRLSQKALAPLLQYLRRLGVSPPVPVLVPSPTEALLGRYRDYLISERGLTNSTAVGYIHLVRPLVRMRERPDGELELESLAAKDITAFLLTDVIARRRVR